MGSERLALGSAFIALLGGQQPSARRLAWSSSQSGSSGTLSVAEPSSGGELVHSGAVAGRGTGASSCRVRMRKGYVLQGQREIACEAVAFREQWFEEQGSLYGWVKAFLLRRYGFDSLTSPAGKAASLQVRSALRHSQGWKEKEKGRQGTQRVCWEQQVAPQIRQRKQGGGRARRCPIIGEELWSWFVDRISTCHTRVGTQRLIDAANVVSGDLWEDWLVRKAQGHADSCKPPKLPAINPVWVQRWRSAYGVTYRTVNLRYKISHTKRMLRLRVFWSNVMRVRLLHECLYGKDGIDFVSMDQKPLYFNSSLASKTLAPRGARKVTVKESVAASRERFTLMTSCVSWSVTKPPGLAVLFRYEGAEDSKVRASVVARRRGLVQWAPKGSYRLLHVLEYLKWAIGGGHAVPDLPRGPPPGSGESPGDDAAGAEARARARAAAGLPAEQRQLIVVLDWFAPHLDKRVDCELAKAGLLACGSQAASPTTSKCVTPTGMGL